MDRIFIFLDLFSAIFIFFLGYYVFLKDSKRKPNKIFFFLSLAATFWAVSSFAFRINKIPMGMIEEEILKVLPPEKIKTYFFWNEIGWIGVAFLPSIFLHLGLVVTGKEKFLKKRIHLLLYSISLIFLLITLAVIFLPPPLQKEISKYFYSLFTIFFIVCLLIFFGLLSLKYIRQRSLREKTKLKYFLIGSLIPGVFGTALDILIPIFRYGEYAGATYSLYSYTLGMFFIALGILRYGLFVDYRETLETIFKRLTELVMVSDEEGRILLTNDITLSKLKISEKEMKEKKVSDFFGKEKWEEMKRKIKEKKFLAEKTFLKGRPFLISASKTKGEIVFVGRDVEEIIERQKKLKEEIEKEMEELREIKSSFEIRVEARKKELQELTKMLEEKVKEKKEKLKERISELERFKKIAQGRERKFEELKKELEGLKKRFQK